MDIKDIYFRQDVDLPGSVNGSATYGKVHHIDIENELVYVHVPTGFNSTALIQYDASELKPSSHKRF